MEENKNGWQRFMQTGRVEDYLSFRQRGQEPPKPGRRIQDSSKYKHFY